MAKEFDFGSLKKETKPKTKNERYIDKIIEKTGLSKKVIKDLIEEKKTELKGLISEEGAIFIIAKELGVDIPEDTIDDAFGTKNPTKEETPIITIEEPKKPRPKIIDSLSEPEEFPLEVVERSDSIVNLPSRAEVDSYLKMYNYVKKKIVDESDFVYIGRRKFLKKSGWRKFIKAFNISIELLEKKIFEFDDDTHAEVRVRASLPNGQFIEGYAIKSKSEFWSEKKQNYGNYNVHNLVATAHTRATNRAISDLVGFGEVSAEEVQTSGGDIEGAFGGKAK